MDYFASYEDGDAEGKSPSCGNGDPSEDVDPLPVTAGKPVAPDVSDTGPVQSASEMVLLPSLDCAPSVSVLACKAQSQRHLTFQRPDDPLLYTNPKVSALEAPIQGESS